MRGAGGAGPDPHPVVLQGSSSRNNRVMDRLVGYHLIAGGLLLAGLGFLAHHFCPSQARTALVAGLVGGGLTVVWGLRALRPGARKAPAVLTLIPLSFVMLSQSVTFWMADATVPGHVPGAIVVTLLCLLSVALLLRVGYAGVVFDGDAPPAARHG